MNQTPLINRGVFERGTTMFRYIWGIVLIVLAVWITLLTTGWDFVYEKSISFIQWITDNHLQSIFIAIVLVVIGFLLVKRPITPNTFLVNKSAEGELRIAFEAIRDLISKSVAEFREYRIARCSIEQIDGELVIFISVYSNNGSNFTDVFLKIQEAVRQNVEKYTGIKVREVKLLIQPPKFLWLSTLGK